MSAQLAIEFPPYQRHSLTSLSAAASIAKHAITDRQRVYNALKASPATDEQLQGLLRLNASTERPRRIKLVEDGLVRDSGRTAKTLSGRSATIWEIV